MAKKKSKARKSAKKSLPDQAVGKPAPTPAKGEKATRTSEQGVGLKNHPANKLIPGKAIIRRQTAEPFAAVSATPTVKGDKSLVVIDIVQKRPVEVFLLDGKSLNGAKGQLIFVQGAVSSGLMTAEGAKSKFAVLPDGTAVYNARGFDDVPTGEFDLLDIAALIESKK